MGRLALTLFLCMQWLPAASVSDLARCAACHETKAPPLSLIYRRYLILYSSKARIQERMIDFLTAPSKAKSAMPEGMKNRFNPQNHPRFKPQTIQKTVKKLIEKEDLIPKIVVPKR